MIIQYFDKVLNRKAIMDSLKYDEEIACENATVVVNKDGKVTGWFNNDIPVCVFTNDEEDEDGVEY